MFPILAGLKRPTARLAVALVISVAVIASSLQLPVSSADSAGRPLRVDVTQQIASAGDDVNEDGTSFDASLGTLWLGTGANPSASYTGLRFANLAIPQGATITSAKLQVYLSSASWSSLSFDYFADNSGNSAVFSSSSRPSQRTLTSQVVSHSSNVNWPANTWIDLDQISTVIQPVISRSDWASGNALSIILKGVGGAYGRKFVTAYDGTATYAIRLAITYSASGPTSTNTTVAPTGTPTATRTNTPVGPTATASGSGTQLSRQVVGSSDDVNEDGSGFEADNGTVWFGTGANASASYTGLRFTNITIPQGATIASAKLQVYLGNSSWNQLSFDYFAENAGNSATFSTASRPSQRGLTSQSISHSSDVNWPANTWIDLDEISSVVQPVISRSDWTSGNALSLVLKGTGGAYGRKYVTSYEGSSANAIRLVITYTSSATSTPAQVTNTPLPTATTAPGQGAGLVCANAARTVCFQLSISQSGISLGQPIPATLVITSTTSVSQVEVDLSTSSPSAAIIDGQSHWTMSLQPGQTATLSSVVRFTATGWFSVSGSVKLPGSDMVSDIESVHFAGSSGVANPSNLGDPEVVSDDTLQPPDGISATAGGWQTVTLQNFDSTWPTGAWSSVDIGGATTDIKWDDESYSYHWKSGTRSAWPAGAGANGITPTDSAHSYLPSMDTRMIYGPFDLQDATMAKVSFWMWRQIETTNDYLALEVSIGGAAYQEVTRWSGIVGWEYVTIPLNQFAGQSNVRIAWRFKSNATLQYEGPWIDDVLIEKYVPGTVTISGSLRYFERNGAARFANDVSVEVYEYDGNDVDLLFETTTGDGVFTVGPIRNWDIDDPSSDPSVRRLDIAVLYITQGSTIGHVTRFDDSLYVWEVDRDDIPDAVVYSAATVPANSNAEHAVWIYQDLVRAHEFLIQETGENPQAAGVKWEFGQNTYAPCLRDGISCFWPYAPINGVFVADSASTRPDVVVHEIAHQYMFNVEGFWPFSTMADYVACFDHQLFTGESEICAWSEGWADFYPLVANQSIAPAGTTDWCFDYREGNCGSGNWNLEVPPTNLDYGPTVEGRVASSLYDLVDNHDDGADVLSAGVAPVWNAMKANPHPWTFRDFWINWMQQGNDNHVSVQILKQNTINFNSLPVISPVTTYNVLQGGRYDNLIDLRQMISDVETDFARLQVNVVGSPSQCNITKDSGGFLDVAPSVNWYGICTVQLSVSDGLDSTTMSFSINVKEIRSKAALPVIIRSADDGGASSGDAEFQPGTDSLIIQDPGGYPGPDQ